MATPRIISVTVPDAIPCGKRIDIVFKVRVYNKDTNLTVCFALREPTSCRFVSLTPDLEKKQEECRRRTTLPIGTHELTFRVKLTCPKGDSYGARVDVTARNDKDEMDTRRELWRIDCV